MSRNEEGGGDIYNYAKYVFYLEQIVSLSHIRSIYLCKGLNNWCRDFSRSYFTSKNLSFFKKLRARALVCVYSCVCHLSIFLMNSTKIQKSGPILMSLVNMFRPYLERLFKIISIPQYSDFIMIDYKYLDHICYTVGYKNTNKAYLSKRNSTVPEISIKTNYKHIPYQNRL